MHKLVCILLLLSCTGTEAQISTKTLYGVWTITAMGKLGDDSAVILNRDTSIIPVFPAIAFSHVGDKMQAAPNPAQYLAYATLGMFSNMFMQFDSSGTYGEGMTPKTTEEKPVVKRGSYTVKDHTLLVVTAKTERFEYRVQDAFLLLISPTGSMMYLAKTSRPLY